MSCNCLNRTLIRLGLLRIAQETIFFRVEGGFFVLMEVHNCETTIGEKQLFAIPEWIIYENDRIGIVGRNGSGKTTLLNVLAEREMPETGWVKSYAQTGFIEQVPENEPLVPLSGGERTKEQIEAAFAVQSGIIFADEPTSHLDENGRKYLEKKIRGFSGAVLIVSHDRAFLNAVCTQIVELEAEQVHFYTGNYSAYQKQKQLEVETAAAEYEAYEKERRRLKQAMEVTKRKTDNVRTTPKRMGNSESRLHKMGGQGAKKTLDNARKNLEKRMEHMEIKRKPPEVPAIRIKLDKGREIHNPVLVSGTKTSKTLGEKELFNEADFQLLNHSRTALIGPNGSGKTTLINMILNGEEGIHRAKNIHFGYFSQTLDLLNETETILANVMKKSVHEENVVRTLLARMLFKGPDVYKKVAVLSGGEKNKVSLVLLLASDANVLVFDEPTNYLDIASIEAVEEAMKSYEGTILFVSHDTVFVEQVATHLWEVDHQKIISKVVGSKNETEQALEKTDDEKDGLTEALLVENRLTALIGKLSMPSKNDDTVALEQEYQQLLTKMKLLKKIGK